MNDEMQVANVLQGGLNDKAEEIDETARWNSLPGFSEWDRRAASSFGCRRKMKLSAVALAQAILAKDPIAMIGRAKAYHRQRALDALKTFKTLKWRIVLNSINNWPTRCCSVRTVYLLAEAYSRRRFRQEQSLYRKLVRLKPPIRQTGHLANCWRITNSRKRPCASGKRC